MKIILLTFLFLNSIISCGHKLNSEVESSVSMIIEENIIYDESFWIRREESYTNFLKVSTIDDLVFLTNHKHQRIRYYAFLALIDRNYPEIKAIFFKHENDTASIYMTNGACLRGYHDINILMLRELNPKDSNFKYCFTQSEYETEYDKITK